MAQTKATKKFEKKHLKDTLKRRKDFAKIKQRHQLKEKRKARRDEESEQNEEAAKADSKNVHPAKKQKHDLPSFENMTVDEFFAGGFDIPEEPAKLSRKAGQSAKRKRTSAEDEPVAAEENSDEEIDGASNEEDDEIETHRQDLKAVAEKDPDFYKYLQENDPELLEFAETSNLAEIDDLSGSDEEATAEKGGKKKKQQRKEVEKLSNELTKTKVKNWTQAMTERQSLRSMREIVLAFRAAAHLDDEEEEGKTYKYTIKDADVYHEVLLSALQYIPDVLNHHIPIKELANGKTRISTDSKKFRTLSRLLKSHATSLHHLLENLSDAATVKITLASVLALLPYLLSFKKLIREVSRTVTDIWSDSAQTEATRISAFLVLRRLVVIGDPSIIETVLRTSYQGLLKGSRNTTVHTIAGINLMKNSAAELWGLAHADVSYTSGFTLIRQLAIHLRACIKNNSNDSYKTVYNWQYVHALDFWSRVLSTHCETLREATSGRESPLRPLIYPLVQVTLGAMRLIPTAAYFPLQFHLVRALLRLSHTTQTFIPLAAQLYEVLTSAEMRKPPKPSTSKPLEFDTTIHAAKGYLHTRVYQDGVGEQVVELFAEFFNIWTKSIAFPELALPVIVMLKRWLKEVAPFNPQAISSAGGLGKRKGNNNKARDNSNSSSGGGNRNGRLNSSVHLLIQKLEANSRWIEERRAKVEFAPNNRAGVESFLKDVEWTKTPLGAFVEGQRKSREERRKVLEQARKQDEAKREREKARAGKDIDDGENEDEHSTSENASDDDEQEDGEAEGVGLVGESELEEEDELEEEEEEEEDEEEEEMEME